MNEEADVVVIGGGPAGSTAATLIRQRDPSARVVVLERARFPRHHIGESMLPTSNAILAKLGVLHAIDEAGFLRKGGAVYKWSKSGECFRYIFAEGVNDAMRLSPDEEHIPDFTWQVERARYDELLLRNARARGVIVREGARVQDVVRDGDRVTGVRYRAEDDPAQRVITCSHVIDASGHARVLGRLLGIPKRDQALGDLAVYRYYEGAAWDESLLGTPELSNIFFAATSTGWIWFIPLSRERVSVGLVSRREFIRERGLDALFDEELATVPEMTAMLRSARVVPPTGEDGPPRTHTIQNWSYCHEQVAGPGWYLVGDAAAFVDPVLSSGTMLAHATGLWAANAVLTERGYPEIDPATLREEYGRVYADARAGFVSMARWWYHRRDVGIEDWWREAGVLARQTAGHASLAQLDDLSAFTHLLAGYLTDLRFTTIELGFGYRGLSECLRGLTGVEDPFGARDGSRADPLGTARPRWDHVSLDWFLGTYVETDRWWRLPLVRFTRGDERITYRPRIGRSQRDGAPEVELLVAVLDAVLAVSRDGAAIADIPWTCARWLGGDDERRVRGLATRITRELVQLTLLDVGAPVEVLRSRSQAIPSDARALAPRRRGEHRVRWWTPGAALGLVTEREPAPTLEFDGDPVRRYRPPADLTATPARTVAIVEAVLDACDGQRTVDQVVRHARAQLVRAGAEERAAHRAANIALDDLVAVGAVTLNKSAG